MAPPVPSCSERVPWTGEPSDCRPADLGSSCTAGQLHSLFTFNILEKAVTPHSTILAWRLPGEAGGQVGCHLWGCRVADRLGDSAAAAGSLIVCAHVCAHAHCAVLSDSCSPWVCSPPGLCHAADFSSKNTGVEFHFFLRISARPRDPVSLYWQVEFLPLCVPTGKPPSFA